MVTAVFLAYRSNATSPQFDATRKHIANGSECLCSVRVSQLQSTSLVNITDRRHVAFRMFRVRFSMTITNAARPNDSYIHFGEERTTARYGGIDAGGIRTHNY